MLVQKNAVLHLPADLLYQAFVESSMLSLFHLRSVMRYSLCTGDDVVEYPRLAIYQMVGLVTH